MWPQYSCVNQNVGCLSVFLFKHLSFCFCCLTTRQVICEKCNHSSWYVEQQSAAVLRERRLKVMTATAGETKSCDIHVPPQSLRCRIWMSFTSESRCYIEPRHRTYNVSEHEENTGFAYLVQKHHRKHKRGVRSSNSRTLEEALAWIKLKCKLESNQKLSSVRHAEIKPTAVMSINIICF